MSFEKKYARYIAFSKDRVNSIKNGRFEFLYLDRDEEQKLQEQISEWQIHESCSYSYEYDDYEDKSTGYYFNDIDVFKILSTSSGCYSSSDILGEILVENGLFVGVVIKITEEGGGGWSSYKNVKYSILYLDGKYDGKPESYYSFSGESSSKESTTTYSLRKKA